MAVTGLQLYRRHRIEMIVAVDAAGNLTIFFENGTELLSRATALPSGASAKNETEGGATGHAEAAEAVGYPNSIEGVVAIASSAAPNLGQYFVLTTVHVPGQSVLYDA